MRRFLIFFLLCFPACLLCGCRRSGTPPHEETARDAKTVDPQTAPFVAGKRNKVYHSRQCPYAAGLNSPAGFSGAREAEASGRIPCEFCSPHKAEQPAPEPSGGASGKAGAPP